MEKAGERRRARRGWGHRKVVGLGQTLMGNGDDEVVGEVEMMKSSGVVRMRRMLMMKLELRRGKDIVIFVYWPKWHSV